MEIASRPAQIGLRVITLLRKDTSIVLGTAVAANLARMASTLVLTRILDVEAYGVVGILTSISYTIVMLTDVGIYGYVVRHGNFGSPRFLDEAWTLRLIRQAGLAAAMAAAAPLLAALLHRPIGAAIAVYSLTLLIDGLASMAFATAPRERRLLRLSVMELLPQLASIPVAVAFGLLLRSYWALVIAMIFASLLRAGLSYTLFPDARRHWLYSRKRARELWLFGRALGGASLIQLFLMQTDKLVLARLLPLDVFGLYVIASTLALLIRTFNGDYTKRVLFPAFVRVRDADKVVQRRAFYAAGRPLRILYAFAACGFVTCAPLVVTALYDPRYLGAIPFLTILAVGNIFSMSSAAANEMMMALGRTRHVLFLNVTRAAALVTVGVAGFLLLGSVGLVVAFAAADVGAQLYCWRALARHGLLDVRQEALTFGIGCAGFLVGPIVNWIGLQVVS